MRTVLLAKLPDATTASSEAAAEFSAASLLLILVLVAAMLIAVRSCRLALQPLAEIVRLVVRAGAAVLVTLVALLLIVGVVIAGYL